VELDSGGFFIGIFNEQEFEEKSIQLNPGDKILFYTDGATDIKNKHDKMFGRKNLRQYFRHITENGSIDKGILDLIFHYLQDYARNSMFDDDLTLLLLERSES
jgi:sigma-B regulation protein RsbU (phosphoserine phosphatase)